MGSVAKKRRMESSPGKCLLGVLEHLVLLISVAAQSSTKTGSLQLHIAVLDRFQQLCMLWLVESSSITLKMRKRTGISTMGLVIQTTPHPPSQMMPAFLSLRSLLSGPSLFNQLLFLQPDKTLLLAQNAQLPAGEPSMKEVFLCPMFFIRLLYQWFLMKTAMQPTVPMDTLWLTP